MTVAALIELMATVAYEMEEEEDGGNRCIMMACCCLLCCCAARGEEATVLQLYDNMAYHGTEMRRLESIELFRG